MPPSTSTTDVGDRIASEDAEIRVFRIDIPREQRELFTDEIRAAFRSLR
jgi:hypothetical protein